MNIHTGKTQEDKGTAAANSLPVQEKSKAAFQAAGKHPGMPAQRKLQEMADNSAPVKQLKAIQAMADSHTLRASGQKENNTGLPGPLKSGVESLSGMSMDDVKVHYHSDKPAQLNALAYAQGSDIHLGAGQERHLPHEAWHVVQQKQGRVQATLQMKQGVAVNDDPGLEREADNMGAQALASGTTAWSAGIAQKLSDGNTLHEKTAGNASTIQRWVVPGEDAAANTAITRLEAIQAEAIVERGRARALAGNIPVSLRASWPTTDIPEYATADGVRADAGTAIRLAQPATRPLATLQLDVTNLDAQLVQVRANVDAFTNGYALFAAGIAEQTLRHANMDALLASPDGLAKAAQWTALAGSVMIMDQPNMTLNLAAFAAPITAATGLTETSVAAARLLGAGTPKNIILQHLAEFFDSGRIQLNTWAKFYPTNWDLKTGEFGAEWYIKSSAHSWLGKKWVFHAHCETIRDEHGGHNGFRFKNIIGTNHIKLISERMATGVSLDLPLMPSTLTAMAAPYQAEFFARLQDDSEFRAVLKKSRPR